MSTTVKTCFKCNTEKQISEFYRHSGMLDGHLNKCEECAKLDVRRNRAANSDYYREYDRKRGCRQPSAYLKKYRKENPEKERAHRMVNYRVAKGVIVKPKTCEGCGKQRRLEAHHEDYSKPLDVVWLCSPCHKFTHSLKRFNEVYDLRAVSDYG